MLGEMIGECTGQVSGIRVISTEGQETKLEVSLRGQGTLLGQPIADFGTLVQSVRPGAVLSGDAHHVMMTTNGEVADWSGGGVGQATGAGFKSTWGGYGRFSSPHGAFEPLEAFVTAIEFDVEENGSYRWRMWAWTGASVPQAVGAR
jgi:hypothetical protein